MTDMPQILIVKLDEITEMFLARFNNSILSELTFRESLFSGQSWVLLSLQNNNKKIKQKKPTQIRKNFVEWISEVFLKKC